MFVNRLVVTLKLTIKGKSFEIPGGNIKNFDIKVTPYGFECDLDFWICCIQKPTEDKLYSSFYTTDIIEVELTVDRKFDKVGESAEPLKLKGIVGHKTCLERSFPDLNNDPIMQRHYRIYFADRARVLWLQHFPTKLYVDKTLKDVIEDNKPKDVKLSYDFEALTKKYRNLSLGMGLEANLASFYDYVHWLSDRFDGAIFYDTDKETYKFSTKKVDLGKEEPLPQADVGSIDIKFPATRRETRRVHNAYSEAATKMKTIKNDDSVTNVYRDFLIRSQITKDLDTRNTLETGRAEDYLPHLFVDFERYPSVTVGPSMIFNFTEDWSTNHYYSKKKYRVVEQRVVAKAESQEATDDAEDPSNSYEIDYTLLMEQKEETNYRYHDFVVPHWPFRVEGKVLSEQGTEEQGTYQFYKDADTKVELYKVKVPLFANILATVAYLPNAFAGHFYFPLYRDERVLLDLYFDDVEIIRYLDWRPGARLPMETQGNHLLMGKKDLDETSMRHVYEDKKPVLSIKRTNAKDQQTIVVSEGTVFISTLEEK